MRWLSLLITLPLTVLVVLFAVSNRTAIEATLWPFPFVINAPFFLYVLLALLVGFLAGAALVWVSSLRYRTAAWREKKRAQKLEQELAEARREALLKPTDPPAPAPAELMQPLLPS